jgi:hypothetical protein
VGRRGLDQDQSSGGRLDPLLANRNYDVMAATGTSGGDLTKFETRLDAEARILGIRRDAPPTHRPISGYLQGSDEEGAITAYGSIVLELDDTVRQEAWFLLGDLVDTPTLGGGQVIAPRPLASVSIDAANGRRDTASAQNLADACFPHRYAEVLMFNGLSPIWAV